MEHYGVIYPDDTGWVHESSLEWLVFLHDEDTPELVDTFVEALQERFKDPMRKPTPVPLREVTGDILSRLPLPSQPLGRLAQTLAGQSLLQRTEQRAIPELAPPRGAM